MTERELDKIPEMVIEKQDNDEVVEPPDNPWNVNEFATTEKAWKERSPSERLNFIVVLFFKVVLAVMILYLFIISLDLMANSFRILGGKTSGRAFRNSDFFDNPIAGLVTGILTTVLVQSSSTSTSIVITMTAGDLIEVSNAIPMIMGANIGTSLTNTLVSLGSFRNKDEYRRAFAGATIHDCFNLLTVLAFLPIEAATGVLHRLAQHICDGLDITDDEEKGSKTDFLKVLTSPVSSRLIGIDKKLITTIAKAKDDDVKKYEEISIIKHKQQDKNHIFMDTPMSDTVAGIIMVIVSLLFLCICLMVLVKLLQTIFRGRIAILFRNLLNLEFESVPGLANYVLIMFGMIITILFQSSSVTTSTLTPLVGIGLVRLDKMFAFTIGANVGTTLTGILSALVSDKRKTGLTVAFSHTLFNLLGTLVWYPMPLMRSVPIGMAKMLGNIAADLKWFPVAYIMFVFGGIPALLLGLSLAGVWLFLFVGMPILVGLFALSCLIGMRANMPNRLPRRLRKDLSWLPNSLRVDKVPEHAPADGVEPRMAANADLGAGNWQAGPAAWSTGWFVVLSLLMVCFNAKWADMKYTSWDERPHYGIGAWTACSYAFKEKMPWAPILDDSLCDASSCGVANLSNCARTGFSTEDGAYLAYQASWASCRASCTAKQWQAWCDGLKCGGIHHSLQCQNVTDAVHRPYEVKYGKFGEFAWQPGPLCRDLKDLCSLVDEPIGVAGTLAVVALAFAAVGQACLVFHSIRMEFTKTLIVSCLFFMLSWVLLTASWATFARTISKDAECIVGAESGKGVVKARGRFGDIINGHGSYTFGFVVGAWCLVLVPITLIVLRIRANCRMPPLAVDDSNKNKPAEPATEPPSKGQPTKPRTADMGQLEATESADKDLEKMEVTGKEAEAPSAVVEI